MMSYGAKARRTAVSAPVQMTFFEMQYAKRTALSASTALLYEVSATPKPGLVDRVNSGAHHDMDFFTFQSSAEALLPYFEEFVLYGLEHRQEEPSEFLTGIRPIGVRAENAMLAATGGVNTHKGAIFSMGILCTAYGYLYESPKKSQSVEMNGQICRVCMEIASPFLEDFREVTRENAKTAGQKLYAEYGITGVRGEAAFGFPTVFKTALPYFRTCRSEGCSINDAGVLALVKIMAELADTNVMHRSSYAEGIEIRERMRALSEKGLSASEMIAEVSKLDCEFIRRNISPGGSADLLALTYFVSMMEEL